MIPRSKTPRSVHDNLSSDHVDNHPLRHSKSLDFNFKKEERVRLDNNIKNILQKQLGLNKKYWFSSEKEAYDNLQFTDRKNSRVEIGPKYMNNFDRQQINQFMKKVEKENCENQKRVMFVNQNIHQLLRGSEMPQAIYEEENEASQSVNMNLQSFDNMLIQKQHKSNQGFMQRSQFSNMIDDRNQNLYKRKPEKRGTNTSSMLGGGSIFNKSGISQMDAHSSNSKSAKSRRSSISSQQLDPKRPIFIVMNQQDQQQDSNYKNFSPSQIEDILKQCKDIHRDDSSPNSQVEICNIKFGENQKVEVIPQNQPVINNYTFNKMQSNSSIASSEDDLDEVPQKKVKIDLNQVIEEEYQDSCSSINGRTPRDRGDEGFTPMSAFSANEEKKESSNEFNVRTAKFAFNGRADSSNISVGRDKIIIEKKDQSPFQSNKKLKQKANEKIMENNINDYEKKSNKSMGCIKHIIDEEIDKSDNKSKLSRRSLISHQNLDKIKEEEAGFSQSIAIKIQRSGSQNSSDSCRFGSDIDNVLDQMMSGSNNLNLKSQSKFDSSRDKDSNKKSGKADDKDEKDFLAKNYIRQQSKAHLKVNFNSKMVKDVVIESDDEYSYKFSSDEDEDSMPINSSSQRISDPLPVSIGKKLRDNANCSLGLKDSLLQTTDRDSSLYEYDDREKKLLAKVIKYMSPAKKNQIWESIFIEGLAGHQQDNYKAIDRMAFERDPARQIIVKILDYNSLEMYQGPFTFSDGMSTIKFNCKRISQNKVKSKRNYSVSCSTFFKQQLFRFEQLNISKIYTDSIKTNSILGLIYGPHSVSFKQYLKNNFRNKTIMNQKCDQWRFISIVTSYQSFDLILDKIEDAFDLIISINEALIKQNEIEFRKQSEKIMKMNSKQVAKRQKQSENNSQSSFVQDCLTKEQVDEYKKNTIEKLKKELTLQNKIIKVNTSKKILRFEMIRRKIQAIADDKGYTMAQYLIITIYNTICQQPEVSDSDVDEKFTKLKNTIVIIKSHPKLIDVLDVIDYSTQQRLQRHKHKVKLRQIMKMGDEERQMHLKSFFQSNQLFGMAQVAPNQTMSSAEVFTEHEISSINSVSEFNVSSSTNQNLRFGFQKASTFKHNDFEDIEDDDNATNEQQDQSLLAVIVEQNQSFEVSSSYNFKEKLSYNGSSQQSKQQVCKQIKLHQNNKKQNSVSFTPTLPPRPLSPGSQAISPSEIQTPGTTKTSKQLAKESWKNWLSQQSSIKEITDPQSQKKSLAKKMRSLRFLNKIKEKKKRKENIQKELEKVEMKNKRRVSNFFDTSVLSMIRRRSNSGALSGVRSRVSSDPISQGTIGNTEMSPDAKKHAEDLKNFEGNEFNYHMIDRDFVQKKRLEIIKWSKNLYCKENRMVQLDKYAKQKPIDENMLHKLYNETDQQIIENQQYIADEMRMINRSNKLDEFKALPPTSNFMISTGRAGSMPENRNLDILEIQANEKLINHQDFENSLTVKEYLDYRAKIAKAANIEWKYEYRRQLNLFKKLIEVSNMKADYDNMTAIDKRKILMANAIDNQKSDAKKLNILMEEDMSPVKRKNTGSVLRAKESDSVSKVKEPDEFDSFSSALNKANINSANKRLKNLERRSKNETPDFKLKRKLQFKEAKQSSSSSSSSSSGSDSSSESSQSKSSN